MTVKNILFMGSPAFAVPSLKLLAQQFNVVAVYTQPPRPAGRGFSLTKTAVHQEAEKLNLPVLHPEKLKGDDLQKLLDTPADAIAVVAYGLLLPKTLVEARTCLNLHPSSLPRWRGAAPLQHTLLNGDRATGICIMKLDAGMDTGPVYTHRLLPVPENMIYQELHDLCATQGAEDLAAVLHRLPELQPTPQTGEATHAFKITPEMRVIDWARPAMHIHNQIRAIGGTTQFQGETLKLQGSRVIASDIPAQPGEILHLDADGLTLATGSGALHIAQLQRPGKKMSPVADVAHGWPALAPGACFA